MSKIPFYCDGISITQFNSLMLNYSIAFMFKLDRDRLFQSLGSTSEKNLCSINALLLLLNIIIMYNWSTYSI